MFRGRHARRIEDPGAKLEDFLGELKCLAWKVEESNGVWDHLVVRGFSAEMHNSQVGPDLRKSFVDADLLIEKYLEKILKLAAVTRIEEDERESKFAIFQPDSTERLICSMINVVESLSLSRGLRNDN